MEKEEGRPVPKTQDRILFTLQASEHLSALTAGTGLVPWWLVTTLIVLIYYYEDAVAQFNGGINRNTLCVILGTWFAVWILPSIPQWCRPAANGSAPAEGVEAGPKTPWLLVCAMSLLLAAIVWGFTREGAPDPTGLLCGLAGVGVGQIAVLIYYAARRTFFGGSLIQSKDHVVSSLAADVRGHLAEPEGFLMLTCYLAGTWLLRIMPESYYDVESRINWLHVLLQLLLTDFLMFVMHYMQHQIRSVYRVGHKPHHRWLSPKLTDAFNGSVTDTLIMILIPLVVTARTLHVCCWSYIAFGALYSMSLCLIHAEWRHPWDGVFALLGIGTAADHHVHHRNVVYNFGHLFTYWDRLFGKYKSPDRLFKVGPGDASKHQGSYGKVKVHKHGALATLLRPAELAAAVRYKIRGKGAAGMLLEGAPEGASREDILFCEQMLVAVSRSFAAVIRGLAPELRLPVAVFYLVLRALDTVEDEMDLKRFEPHCAEGQSPYEAKLALLAAFEGRLKEETFRLTGIGEADERRLLEEFDKVLRVFKQLGPAHCGIIAGITKRMAKGMVDFAGRDLAAGTKDVADLSLYCHYVAGLVGHGLAEQFVASGLEGPELTSEKSMVLANQMGLFLQMANIIRDYLEDLLDSRSFWPQDVVTLYGKSLVDLREGGEKSVACMNHLIADVLFNGQNSLAFLALLKDPSVFRFCAIPQVMAMATLAELYGNPKVFTGVVKIRSGLAARILEDSNDMAAVRRWFARFASDILSRIDPEDPNAARTAEAARALGGATSKALPGDAAKHQGSYGKVKVHKHGALATLLRPAELAAGIRYKIRGKGAIGMLLEGAPEGMCRDDVLFCEEMLVAVSRSFAAVIRDLAPALRLPVAVFYLVLRALDTIEDEMDLKRFEPHCTEGRTPYETKLALLLAFEDKLGAETFTLAGIGEADERRLLEQFDKVLRVFKCLGPAHCRIIAGITKRMAKGMVDFAGRDLAAGTKDVADLQLYCHYVAGLVGHGLAEQFVASGLEGPDLTNEKSMVLANQMGLFLQMANIIRDYLEDLLDGRSFWPQEVVKIYAKSLVDLRDGGELAVACMNHLITDVLFNGQNSLAFLGLLKDPSVFKFCAIPQVMAMATLAELYSNPKVFTGVVKIRSGLAARILGESGNMEAVKRWFARFASEILGRIDSKDPSSTRTAEACRALGGV